MVQIPHLVLTTLLCIWVFAHVCRHTCAAQKRRILTCHCDGELIAKVHRMWTLVHVKMCVTTCTCVTLSTYSFFLQAGELFLCVVDELHVIMMSYRAWEQGRGT